MRDKALLEIENLRKDKKVGKSLECNLNWYIPDHSKGVYEQYVRAIAEATIVSNVQIIYWSQNEIENRLLTKQIIDTEKAGTAPKWLRKLKNSLLIQVMHR